MMHKLDGKFSIDADCHVSIVNTVSGEAIPDDEPLFLLRARDSQAINTLMEYYYLCKSSGASQLHLGVLKELLDDFCKFRSQHPERMKLPSTTGDVRYKNGKQTA